ncbi:MAG: transporter substrate-binding domain-containing protein [Bacteroidales bacterium]|nr:transporter substrate-binding domain-containing protein [Bacteroidales bacterium]
MIKQTHRASLVLLIIFTVFWSVFAILYGIDRHNKMSSDMPRIIKRGVIRVCGEEDLFSFYTDRYGPHGFHYELAKAFADRHHLDLEYISKADFEDRLELLHAGKCDILAGPLPMIKELQGQVAYTEPLLESCLVLIQRDKAHNDAKKPVRDPVLLGRKKIFFTAHSPNIIRTHHLSIEICDSIYIRYIPGFNTEDNIKAVSNKFVNFFVCDKMVARSYLKKYPGIDIQTRIGFTQIQVWAVRPEKNSLLDSLNIFISEYRKSPAFARLLKKYSD